MSVPFVGSVLSPPRYFGGGAAVIVSVRESTPIVVVAEQAHLSVGRRVVLATIPLKVRLGSHRLRRVFPVCDRARGAAPVHAIRVNVPMACPARETRITCRKPARLEKSLDASNRVLVGWFRTGFVARHLGAAFSAVHVVDDWYEGEGGGERGGEIRQTVGSVG